MGSLFERLASPRETHGLDVALVTQPPGIATPLHRHTHEAEAFFLLDGSMTYRAGEMVYKLTVGDFIYLPSGVPHAFRVTGSVPVRFVGFTDPGGLFDLYDEVGIPAVERRLPGRDGLPMEVEISRWNTVGPGTASRSSVRRCPRIYDGLSRLHFSKICRTTEQAERNRRRVEC